MSRNSRLLDSFFRRTPKPNVIKIRDSLATDGPTQDVLLLRKERLNCGTQMAYMRFGVTVLTAWTCVLLGNQGQCLMAASKDNCTSYLQTTPFNTTLHL